MVKLVSGKFRGRVLREGLTMVVAAATGVVLDVAAVVVVAHLNFGASKFINDCVHHLVVDDVFDVHLDSARSTLKPHKAILVNLNKLLKYSIGNIYIRMSQRI